MLNGVDLCQESCSRILFIKEKIAFLWIIVYLCNVFFIVLDLRLTKAGT